MTTELQAAAAEIGEWVLNALAKQGYTLRRETITEVELEREAEDIVISHNMYARRIGETAKLIEDLAKKYRG